MALPKEGLSPVSTILKAGDTIKRHYVCVYAISKNQERLVDRWMDSMKEADLVVVTDTGSTDRTVEKLERRGAIVYVDMIRPWRFDAARNRALDHAPADAEICVCTDLDEVFESGWRQKLEDAWQPGTTAGTYLYNWSRKADGTPDVQLSDSKIHARYNYEWVYPAHESLKYVGREPEKKVLINGLVLNRYPDTEQSGESYLTLLETAVRETPGDDRMIYYLGREYTAAEKWEECIDTLRRYLALPSAIWNEERCSAMRWIANAYDKLSNTQEAQKWYFRAIAEVPYMREPYVDFGVMAYSHGDWPTVFYMMEKALTITEMSTSYENLAYAWNQTPDDLCAIACYWLGMYDRSLAHERAALGYAPDDTRLQSNLALIEEKCH